MAAAAASVSASASLSLNQHRSVVPKHHGFSLNSRIRVPARFSSNGFTSRIRATSAVAAESELRSPAQDDTEAEFFACPICYEPLIRKGPSGFNVPAIYRSGFKCRKCNKSYSSKDIYLDLTVTSGTKQYNEVKPARSELFRSPIVSFLYERGWRQNFNRSGFPGPDEEFKMAQEYFKVVEGGVLVDISCGSGLFSRKFAKSGAYSKVVALDFSENMLRQCYDFIKNDESIISSNLALVRAMFPDYLFPLDQSMLCMQVLPCIVGHLHPMLLLKLTGFCVVEVYLLVQHFFESILQLLRYLELWNRVLHGLTAILLKRRLKTW